MSIWDTIKRLDARVSDWANQPKAPPPPAEPPPAPAKLAFAKPTTSAPPPIQSTITALDPTALEMAVKAFENHRSLKDWLATEASEAGFATGGGKVRLRDAEVG